MSFTRNRRSVFLTLLFGLIASATSTSALADSAEFNMMCSGCHGTTPGLNPGSGFVPIDVNKFTSSSLRTYIDANMPVGSPAACDAACAQRMADYLKPPLPPGPNNPPVADASITRPTVGAVPLKISFFANASTDDHGIVSYAWNFGDGVTGSGQFVQHTYTVAGTYTATLTVADAHGLTNSTTLKIYASTIHTPPVINTSRSTNLSGVSPLTATFDATLSTCTGGCKQFSWQFGDNTSASGPIATHTFNTVGTHTVTLNVYDGGDISDPATGSKATLTVTVSTSPNTPVANATKSLNLQGAAPLTAKFDASLSNCANSCGSYAWNFGDGTTATVSDPKVDHTYQNAGSYTATLTVTDKSNGKKSSTTVAVTVVPAESLTSYVQACRTQLNFQNVSIPNLDCYDGDLFATPEDFNKNSAVRDFVGYKKITDQVDVAFACRWLGGDKTDRQNPISVELLAHNRQNGNTCFFSAKGFVSGETNQISTLITSPTSANAASYWDQPAKVDANIRCVGCHISGPYIATPTVAPFLAKYGLLNNGHDTLHNVTTSNTNAPVKYHAVSGTVNGVPGAFSLWDSLKRSYIDPAPDKSGCSQGCHVVGTLSPQGDIGQIQLGFTTILTNPAEELKEIAHHNAMPPYEDSSDYRWINLDTAGDGVETESFAASVNATHTLVPKLFGSENPNCAQPNVPNVMQAHVVGSDNHFIIAQPSRFAFLPDKLAVFNLKDGLVCLNSDQDPNQQCQDYRIRYECTDPTGIKTWTEWYNTDSPSYDGDHEERNRHQNVCASPGGSTATGIEAAITHSANGWTYTSIGPNDRLARFSQYGLTCNTADQPDGQCSNYVVRYSSCSAPPITVNKYLRNVFTNKELTAASSSLVKGQGHNGSWNTQQWAIEPVANTEYVRLRNIGANVYLNVTSQAESATVGTGASSTATSQMWLIEPVIGSTDVRFRNLWTGKYLTMADPQSFPSTPDYLPIFSQTRNTGWTSQRWVLQ